MQKLNQAQLAELTFKNQVFNTIERPSTKFFVAISELQIGEGLLILRDEWPNKNPPHIGAMPTRLKQAIRKYRQNSLEDDSGWVITRFA